MKINTVKRHFRESFRSIGRNAWMTFASISAVTVTLLLVGVFLVIMMNINNFAKQVENDVEIRVFIDVAATEEDREKLKSEITKLSQVESITYSPKEEELEALVNSMGEDGEVFNLFEQNNPLNDVFIVKTKQPDDVMVVAPKIKEMAYAYDAVYGKGKIEKLFSFFKVSRNIGLALIMGLVFTAMFLISNTIKITIVARRTEIEIMKLVGATNAFIRWPFFLEGLWLGVFGSIIPIVLILTAYNYLYNWLISQQNIDLSFITLLPSTPFAFQVAGILVAIGAIIGAWGSLMSIRKFLRV